MNEDRLALLEIAERDAETAIAELKARWESDDAATAAAREIELGRHTEGAKVRADMRAFLGGRPPAGTEPLAEVEPEPTSEFARVEAAPPTPPYVEPAPVFSGMVVPPDPVVQPHEPVPLMAPE